MESRASSARSLYFDADDRAFLARLDGLDADDGAFLMRLDRSLTPAGLERIETTPLSKRVRLSFGGRVRDRNSVDVPAAPRRSFSPKPLMLSRTSASATASPSPDRAAIGRASPIHGLVLGDAAPTLIAGRHRVLVYVNGNRHR